VNQELGGAHVDGQKAVIDDLNETVLIDSGSTPDGAYAFSGHVAMTGSAVTIDMLDAQVDTEGNTITMSGQKIRAIKFKNPSTANTVTITAGASNGLLIFGTAGSVILDAGASVLLYQASAGITIDATHCNIDCTGTNGQYLDYVVVCG
jgi:hypothetical protein